MTHVDTPGPVLSAHFAHREPSSIRVASIRFAQRRDDTRALNVAIGNVSLPMHPLMHERMKQLGDPGSPFAGGVVRYTQTAGLDETRAAVLNVIASSGLDTEGLHAQITDGGSQAMELMIVGCCGPAGSDERPLMMIDPAYTNYSAFAHRLGRRVVTIRRELDDEGHFGLPPLDAIEEAFEKHRPGALVVIPYDNPTGQLYERDTMIALAKLCVRYGTWLVSDEAYRELHYRGDRAISVWSLTEDDVPGITGHRISIETTSKVWNACGLRIGALVTDNAELHTQAVAENTASLCSNHIGQWILAGLAEASHADLRTWYDEQRIYYRAMMTALAEDCHARMDGLIVSSPDASLYSVLDVRNVVDEGFDALPFVLWCAEEGRIDLDGEPWTLLTAPMADFYDVPRDAPNPGRTQMRVAFVEPPERMARVPQLFTELLERYLERG
jgi:aspartate aminotransferase